MWGIILQKKKLLIFVVLLISLSLLFVGCENSSPTSSSDDTYSISGQVQNLEEEGIEDVTISVAGSSKSVTTDSEGKFSITGLSGNNDLLPAKEYYAFKPDSVTVTDEEEVSFQSQKLKIVFTSGRDDGNEGSDMFSINIDGTNISEYYTLDEHIWGGMVSPDGSKIAYIKPRNETRPYNNDIFVHDFETD